MQPNCGKRGTAAIVTVPTNETLKTEPKKPIKLMLKQNKATILQEMIQQQQPPPLQLQKTTQQQLQRDKQPKRRNENYAKNDLTQMVTRNLQTEPTLRSTQ